MEYQNLEDNRTTQGDLYYSCIEEIDNLRQYALKGVVNEIVNKYKSYGLKGIYLKDVRAYIKVVFKNL
jgi:hypothetical protein